MGRLAYTIPVGSLDRSIYAGAVNSLEVTLWENAAVFDAATYVVRLVVYLAGHTIDSDDHPTAFDWTLGDGRVRLLLGGFDLGVGPKSLRLVVYDTSPDGDPVNGRVWVDGLPVYLDRVADLASVLIPGGAVILQGPDAQYFLALDESGTLYSGAVPDVAAPWDALYFRDLGGVVRKLSLAAGGVPQTEEVP